MAMSSNKCLIAVLGVMTLLLIPLLVLTIITFIDVQNNPKASSSGATTLSSNTGSTASNTGSTVSPVTPGTTETLASGETRAPHTTSIATKSTSTKATTSPSNTTTPQVCNSFGCQSAANMILSGMDQTQDPCQDFYQYACGAWVQANPPLNGQKSTSSFDQVQTGINQVIAQNLSQIDPFNTAGAAASIRTAAFIYQSCQASNQLYPNPKLVANVINSFNTNGWPIITSNWTNPQETFDPSSLIADLDSLYLLPTLLNSLVTVDAKNIERNMLYIGQATLGLGAREYYINPLFADTLSQYRDLIANVSLIMCKNQTGGCPSNVEDQIRRQAQDIVNYEVTLARKTVPATELRNYTTQFNNFTFNQLTTRFSSKNFDWTQYLTHLLGPHFDEIPPTDYYVISQPGFVDEMLADFNSFDPVGDETIINYLIWRYVFDNLMFVTNDPGDSYKKLQATVKGLKDLPPSPSDCANVIINYMPYVAGYVYVTNKWPDASTVIMDGTNMINNILTAFSSMLSQLNWFDVQSLNGANKKITDIIRNVAYPPSTLYTDALDQIYASFLSIISKTELNSYLYVLNELKSDVQEMNFQQILLPGDRTNFQSSPALVNAWYQPQLNSITFPAAIFNPPYYSLNFPKSVNYGALGAVMGHELSHAFDDEGLQFYDNGTLYTWMTTKTQQGFQTQADCIRSEYNQFCYPEQYNYLCVNGITTQGENIADNGGIVAAFNAYQMYRQLHGNELPLPGLEKFSSEQLFFLSYAHLWCSAESPSAIDSQVLVDPHSPAYYRVLGTLKNFDAFGNAFNCKRGDNYFPNPIDQCPMYQPEDSSQPKSHKKREVKENKQEKNAQVNPATTCITKGCSDAANLIADAMNSSADPCDDFYQFACGNWIKNTVFAQGEQITNAAFQQQMAIMTNVTNYLSTVSVTDETTSKAVRTAKIVYESCMNSKDDPSATKLLSGIQGLNTHGWPIIQTSWTKPSGFSLEALIGQLDAYYGIPTLLTSVVEADLINPGIYSLSIDQASLALGYRQYYIDPRYMQNLQDYTNLIVNVAKQLKADNGSQVSLHTIQTDAQNIVNIEVELARKTTPRDDRRNYGVTYHPYNITGLQTRWPFFQWTKYLDNLLSIQANVSAQDKFVVVEPGYIDEMHGDWNYIPNPLNLDVRAYVNFLVWRYIYPNLMFLGAPYNQLYQNFKHSAASASLLPPPQYICSNLLIETMGLVVGDIFLNLTHPNSQSLATNYVKDVQTAFMTMLDNLTAVSWMDSESNQNAHAKSKGMQLNMGYPPEFLSANALDAHYETLINLILNNPNATNNFWENWNVLEFFMARQNLQKINQRVNRNDFGISAAAVGAVYIPRRNVLNVAAGAFTPPFFRNDFPRGFIYGAFGSLVGHEMLLGFNDKGIQLNSLGALGQIYTERTMNQFSLMAQCVVGQYSQDCYPDQNYMCVDGENTLGENIADDAGVIAAYNAYEKYISVNGNEGSLPGLGSYSNEQIFFLSYGQSMCQKFTDAALQEVLELDVHPPSRDRVNGALKNFDKFADAFQCKIGDRMAPPHDQHCYVYQPPYQAPPPTTPPPRVNTSPGWTAAASQLEASVNTTMDPCFDFYAFACADWINDNKVIPGEGETNPVSQVQNSIFESIGEIFDTTYNDCFGPTINCSGSIPNAVKAASKAYTICKTSQSSTYANLSFIVSALQDAIGDWPMIVPNYQSPTKGNTSIFGDIGTLEGAYALSTLFKSGVDVDWRNVGKPALYIDEAELVLLSRDYYINPLYHQMMDDYVNLIAETSYLICQSINCGVNNSTLLQYANEIVLFEANIARKKVPLNERRNMETQFNEYNITGLITRWRGIDWDDYLTSLLSLHIDVSKLKVDFVVMSPNYVDQLNGDVLVDASFQNLTTITNYLGWRLVYQNLIFFPTQSAKLKQLQLQSQALPPDSTTCADLVTSFMPFASGNVFVNANYAAINAANQQANFLTQIIVNSFTALFNELTWQDQTTKINALQKVNNMIQNLGYPDWILDKFQLDTFYTPFIQAINPSNVQDFWIILNLLRYNAVKLNFQQLLGSMNRYTWEISPARAAALYQPSRNAFSISAALYNQPFYDGTFPQAVNYGSLGTLLGHELVHAFDDIGVQFTSNGTLNNWMTPASFNNFSIMADCVIEKYNTYCYPGFIDMCVNGVNTQGENIADIGGIEAVYRAYQSYQQAYGEEPRLPGPLQDYTMEQVFFMSYARGICSRVEPATLLLQLQGGVASPAREKVNGVLSNFYKFGEAFQCPVGSPMFPPTEDTCTVYENPPFEPFTPITTPRTTTTTKFPPPIASNATGWKEAADQISPSMNQTINPCDDFYHFACGSWIKRHNPTQLQNRVDVYTTTQAAVNTILINLMNPIDPNDKTQPEFLQTAATIYQSCVKSTPYNASKVIGAMSDFPNLNGWPIITANWMDDPNNPFDPFQTTALLDADYLIPTLLSAVVDVDWVNKNQNLLYIQQGVLALGDRQYYINPYFSHVLDSYKNLIIVTANYFNTFSKAPTTAAQIMKDAQAIVDFEVNLARKTVSNFEKRSFDVMYNEFSFVTLTKRYPEIGRQSWLNYMEGLLQFSHANWTLDRRIIVTQPGYIDELEGEIQQYDAYAYANYLMWRFVNSHLAFLPDPSVQKAYNEFHLLWKGKAAVSQTAKENICIDVITRFMPYVTGYLYLEQYADPAESIGDSNNISMFVTSQILEYVNLSLLANSTKQDIMTKIEKVIVNMGYPPMDKDTNALSDHYAYLNPIIGQTDYWTVLHLTQLYSSQDMFKKLSEPVLLNTFETAPATLLADYDYLTNSINIPLAAMEPPFYQYNFPLAVNFAGIGVFIARQLAHTFDDIGIQFDSNAMLNPSWISDRDRHELQRTTQCVVTEYGQRCYNQPVGLCIDGLNTMEENQADILGAMSAYAGYIAYVEEVLDKIPESRLPGLEQYTMEQIYFISYAQQYCENATPEGLQQELILSPYSPGKDRVNGALRNIGFFGRSFNCHRGDYMYPHIDNVCLAS